MFPDIKTTYFTIVCRQQGENVYFIQLRGFCARMVFQSARLIFAEGKIQDDGKVTHPLCRVYFWDAVGDSFYNTLIFWLAFALF